VSYHAYPNYYLHYWDNALNGFRYTRTSDYAANKVIDLKNDMQAVLNKYHYDGTLHPAKYITLNESNVARRNSEDRTGTDEMQRNFGIKALVLTQKNDVKQYYYFGLAEMIDAPATTANVSWGDEISLMGLYENIANATPATAKLVQAGKAFATTSQMLYGYKYDAARTTALNLPANLDGAAFSKNGEYVYVLWAKALVDNLEQATGVYSFPTALGLSGGVQRYEWNYSETGTKVNVSSLALTLTEAPSFFKASATTPPVTTCTATGTLLREQWDNVGGSSISDIALAATPTSSASLTSFEQITNTGYNYGARLRGYICAPQTGAYQFYVTGDDQAELWLSTDSDPANAVRIASCTQWIASSHDFYRYPSQQSAAITLVAGQRYYIEARHKQAWGAGFVSVAWRLPSGVAQEPIPGAQLSPFVPVTVVTPPPATCSATGSLLREQWTGVSGSLIASIPLSATVSSSSTLTQLEASDVYGFNYGARLRGYVCAPQSGAYTFYVAGDDQAELWLSTDATPANAVQIASCTNWTASAHDFYRYASQQSAAITLVAGQRYYVELRHKQGWGAGYAAVAWRLPNGTVQEPVPGTQLSPFVVAASRGTNGNPTVAGPNSTATELTVYPNPFTQQATVQFDLAMAGSVSLAIYDLQGKLVRQLYKGESEAGVSRNFTVEAQGLSSGLYMLRLVTGQNVLTQKLMLNK
jgi:aspartate 1-decarboxylase